MRSKNFKKFITVLADLGDQGSYNEIRWKYGLALDPNNELTDSVRASFSRMKKHAVNTGYASEKRVSLGEMTDKDYLAHLIYSSTSKRTLTARKELLPKIFERGYYAEAAAQEKSPSEIEKSVLDNKGYSRLRELKDTNRELVDKIDDIYGALIFDLPALKKQLTKSEFEHINLFIGKILGYLLEHVYEYGLPTISEFIDFFLVEPRFERNFSDTLKLEMKKFLELLLAQVDVLKDISRKAFFANFRNVIRSSWQPEIKFVSLTGNERFQRMKKEESLGRLALSPEDLDFMANEYKKWSLEDLNHFLVDVLDIPYDVDAAVLILNRSKLNFSNFDLNTDR